MMTIGRIIVRVWTVLILLASLGLTVWFAIQGYIMPTITCALLTLAFGYFTYYDVKTILRSARPTPPDPPE